MIEQKVKNGAQNGRGDVSIHELHNLLSVIIAEAQLLQLDFVKDDPNYLSAAAIERAGRRLETLIDRLATACDVGEVALNQAVTEHDLGLCESYQ